MKSNVRYSLPALVLAVWLCICWSGCSIPIRKESDSDTPLNHYKIGMQKLEENDPKTPETEFLRAIQLDGKSPLGYTGMAFLFLSRSQYDDALKNADKALKKDQGFVDAYLAKGYTLVTRKRGEAWFRESLESLEKALFIDPENERTFFYLGECYFKAEEYDRAREYYGKVLEKNGLFAARSQVRIAFIDKVLGVGALSKKSAVVVRREKITRAELCVLLVEELKLKELLKQKRPDIIHKYYSDDLTHREKTVQVKSEISGSHDKEWILDVIILDLPFFELFSNGYFYPDRLVTRALFAQVIQGVVALVMNDEAMTTQYIGLESRFDDVHSNYFAFNAVSLCVDKGILDCPREGLFEPNDAVSGIDAVIAIKKTTSLLGVAK